MRDLESIGRLSETYVESMIDEIKSSKVKLAAILIADCGLRLNEVADLKSYNLIRDQNGKLKEISGLKRILWRSIPGTRTISVSWLKTNGLLSDKHEQDMNEILSRYRKFKVSMRAVQISLKNISDLSPSDLRAYFVFKLLRRNVYAGIIIRIFDESLISYEQVLYTNMLT